MIFKFFCFAVIKFVFSWKFALNITDYYDTESDECLNEFLENMKSIKTVYILNSTVVLNYQLIRENYMNNVQYVPAQVYILKTSPQEIESLIFSFRNYVYTDTRNVFVYILSDLDDSVLKILVKYYMYKSFIMHNNSMFTYNPYYRENLHEHNNLIFYKIGECTKGKFISSEKPLFDILPKKWRNTTLKIVYKLTEPFIFNTREGTDVLILQFIQRNLNFKYEMLEVRTEEEIKNALKNELYDLCLGCSRINVPYKLNFGAVYMYDEFTFFFPLKKAQVFWMLFFSVFTINTWILLILILLFNIVIAYFLKDVYSCFPIIFILEQVDRMPKNTISRYLLVGFMIFSLNISTIFKSKYTSLLGYKNYERNLNFEEIFKDDTRMCDTSTSVYEDLNPSIEVENEYRKRLIMYDNTRQCLDETISGNNVVTLSTIKSVEYLYKEYVDSNGDPLVYSKISNYWHIVTIYFNKGLPLFDDFRSMLMRAYETGISLRNYNSLVVPSLTITDKKTSVQLKAQVLTLEHYFFPFLILAVGFFLGIVSFVVEITSCCKLRVIDYK